MAINYKRLQGRATALLTANGKTFTFTTAPSVTRSGGVETFTPGGSLDVVGIFSMFRTHEIGGNIQAGDAKLAITSGPIPPKGSTMTRDGITWAVQENDIKKPTDVHIATIVQLRGIGQ